MVIEDVVHLRPELQPKTLRNLEILEEVHVDVPEARSEELVSHRIRQAAGGVRATDVIQPCAGWYAGCVALVEDSASIIVQKRDVVKGIGGSSVFRGASRWNGPRGDPLRAVLTIVPLIGTVIDGKRRT